MHRQMEKIPNANPIQNRTNVNATPTKPLNANVWWSLYNEFFLYFIDYIDLI